MAVRRSSLKNTGQPNYQPPNQPLVSYLKHFNEITEFSRVEGDLPIQFGKDKFNMKHQISISRMTPSSNQINRIPISTFFERFQRSVTQHSPTHYLPVQPFLLLQKEPQYRKKDLAIQEKNKQFFDSRAEYFSPKITVNRIGMIDSPPMSSVKNTKKHVLHQAKRSISLQELSSSNNTQLTQQQQQQQQHKQLNQSNQSHHKWSNTQMSSQFRFKKLLSAYTNPTPLTNKYLSLSVKPLDSSQVIKPNKKIAPIISPSARRAFDFPNKFLKEPPKTAPTQNLNSQTKIIQSKRGSIQNKHSKQQSIHLLESSTSSDTSFHKPDMQKLRSRISSLSTLQQNIKCSPSFSSAQYLRTSNKRLSKPMTQILKPFYKMNSKPRLPRQMKKTEFENDQQDITEDPYQVKDRLELQFTILSSKPVGILEEFENRSPLIKQMSSTNRSRGITLFDSYQYMNSRYLSRLTIPLGLDKQINSIALPFELEMNNMIKSI